MRHLHLVGLITLATAVMMACRTQDMTATGDVAPTVAGTVLTSDTVQIGSFDYQTIAKVITAITPAKLVVSAQATNTADSARWLSIGSSAVSCQLAARFYLTADRSGTPVYDSSAPYEVDGIYDVCPADDLVALVGADSTRTFGTDTLSLSAKQLPPGHYYLSIVLEDAGQEVPDGEIDVGTGHAIPD